MTVTRSVSRAGKNKCIYSHKSASGFRPRSTATHTVIIIYMHIDRGYYVLVWPYTGVLYSERVKDYQCFR